MFRRLDLHRPRLARAGLLGHHVQRLRPSLAEVSTQKCPHCGGSGFIRSTESTALRVLRGIEEAGTKSRSAAIKVSVPASVAIYILNQKRIALSLIERRHDLEITFDPDDSLIPPNYRLEKIKIRERDDVAPAPVRAGFDMPIDEPTPVAVEEPQEEREDEPLMPAAAQRSDAPDALVDADASPQGDERRGRRRRRRRGRGRGRDENGAQTGAPQSDSFEPAPYSGTDLAQAPGLAAQAGESEAPQFGSDPGDIGLAPLAAEANGVVQRPDGQREGQAGGDDEAGRRRRRGRRGGRRRRPNEGPEGAPAPSFQEAPMPAEQQPIPVAHDPDDDLRARARELYAPASRFGEEPVAQPAPSVRTEEHEWPWNRRTEVVAPTTVTVTPTATDMPEPPVVEAPQPAVIAAAPAPIVVAPQPEAAPVPAAAPPVAVPEVAVPEAEQGPVRKGWWRRLTS